MILGSYLVFAANAQWGIDPIVMGVLLTPIFFLLGMATYSIYHASFEKRDNESLRGLAFFFGLMFIIEVGLILQYGVDYRLVSAAYIGTTIDLGSVRLPLRMLVPFVAAVIMARLPRCASTLTSTVTARLPSTRRMEA